MLKKNNSNSLIFAKISEFLVKSDLIVSSIVGASVKREGFRRIFDPVFVYMNLKEFLRNANFAQAFSFIFDLDHITKRGPRLCFFISDKFIAKYARRALAHLPFLSKVGFVVRTIRDIPLRGTTDAPVLVIHFGRITPGTFRTLVARNFLFLHTIHLSDSEHTPVRGGTYNLNLQLDRLSKIVFIFCILDKFFNNFITSTIKKQDHSLWRYNTLALNKLINKVEHSNIPLRTLGLSKRIVSNLNKLNNFSGYPVKRVVQPNKKFSSFSRYDKKLKAFALSFSKYNPFVKRTYLKKFNKYTKQDKFKKHFQRKSHFGKKVGASYIKHTNKDSVKSDFAKNNLKNKHFNKNGKNLTSTNKDFINMKNKQSKGGNKYNYTNTNKSLTGNTNNLKNKHEKQKKNYSFESTNLTFKNTSKLQSLVANTNLNSNQSFKQNSKNIKVSILSKNNVVNNIISIKQKKSNSLDKFKLAAFEAQQKTKSGQFVLINNKLTRINQNQINFKKPILKATPVKNILKKPTLKAPPVKNKLKATQFKIGDKLNKKLIIEMNSRLANTNLKTVVNTKTKAPLKKFKQNDSDVNTLLTKEEISQKKK